MFYNHLIFSKITLSLRICLKYLVSYGETQSFKRLKLKFLRDETKVSH